MPRMTIKIDRGAVNRLAALFYKTKGNIVSEGKDFSVSQHPTEKECWNCAVIAHVFILNNPIKLANSDKLVFFNVPADLIDWQI